MLPERLDRQPLTAAVVETGRLVYNDREYFYQNYPHLVSLYIANGMPESDTMANYLSQIKIFLEYCDAIKIDALDLREADINNWVRKLRENNYSPSSVAGKIHALKAFYKAAKALQVIEKNPMQEISGHSFNSHLGVLNSFNKDQIQAIIQTFNSKKEEIRLRNTLFVLFMGIEGLRTVEVHKISLEDIDYIKKIIVVNSKGGVGKRQIIYPSMTTFDYIFKYLKAISTEPIRDDLGTPLLLTDDHKCQGKRISRRGIRVVIDKALEEVDLKFKGISCHTLRHSCATNLYDSTKDLRLVQDQLRHANPATTARYAHVLDKLQERPTENLVPNLL